MKAKVALLYKNRIIPNIITFKLPESNFEEPIQNALVTHNMNRSIKNYLI